MKRLHRYLIQSYLGPLVLTFFVVLLVMVMQFLWKYVDDLVGKGLEFRTIGELLFYFALSFIPMALPLGILLASLMTFGNMGENFELTAIKSAGVSLQKFMAPLIVLIVLISIGAFYFSNNILPVTNLKSRSLLYDIQRQRPEFNITPGQFYNGIEGYSLKIAEKDYNTNLLKRILIYDHTEKTGNSSVTYADSGYMKMTPDEQSIVLILYNGYSYNELREEGKKRRRNKDKSHPQRRDKFKQETVVLSLTGFGLNRTEEGLFKNHYAMLNMSQLEYKTDSMKQLLERRKELFVNTMSKNQLFSSAEYVKRFHRSEDLDLSEADSVILNPQEFISYLSQSEQETISEKAIMLARSSKNFVTTSKNTVTSRKKTIKRHEIEWHRKFTLSFACFIFFFIGAPLGAIIRKGGLGLPVTISVLFFVIWYIISLAGEKAVRQEILSPFTGMWISSMILFPIGIFLTYKATNDSAIMNIDTYLKLPKKIISKLTSKDKKIQAATNIA